MPILLALLLAKPYFSPLYVAPPLEMRQEGAFEYACFERVERFERLEAKILATRA